MSISNKNVKQMCRDISKLLQEPLIPSHGEHVKLVKDFFGKLRIYSEQATEDELEEIIRRDIKAQHYENDYIVYSKSHDAVERWYKQTGLVSYLTDSLNIFKQIKSDIQIEQINSASLIRVGRSILKFRRIKVINTKWVKCYQRLQKENKFWFNIVSNSPFVCCAKLNLYFNWCNTEFKFIILDTTEIMSILEDFCKANPKCLIVAYLPNNEREHIKNIYQKVDKLIFITKGECGGDWISLRDEENDLLDIETQSQLELLETTVLFQGSLIALKTIMDDAPKELIDAVTLEKLVSGDKIIISHNNFLNSIDFFIDRVLISSTQVSKSITEIDDWVVIVAAEPGMGKSTLLSGLAMAVKKKSPATWIVRINLCEYSKLFYQWKQAKTTIDVDLAMNFLIKSACREENISSESFETKLFRWYCEQQKIYLLIDEFDDVSPDYTDIVLQLLIIYKYNFTTKLWVTTRKEKSQEVLEKSLRVDSYSLNPFTLEDSKCFLRKFWGKAFNSINDNQLYDNYIEQLFSVLSQYAETGQSDLVGIPFQTKMIALLYQPSFDEYFMSDNSCINSRCLNLNDLYKSFVRYKFEVVLMEEKNKIVPSRPMVIKHIEHYFKIFWERHQRAAFYALVNRKSIEGIFKESDMDFLQDECYFEQVGIISRVVDGMPIFVNQSFADFFAAQYIWEKYCYLQDEGFEKFVDNILINVVIKGGKVRIAEYLRGCRIDDCANIAMKASVLMKNLLNVFLEKTWLEFKKPTYSFILGIIEQSLAADSECYLKLRDTNVIHREKWSILFLKASECGYNLITRLVTDLEPGLTNITFNWLKGWTALHFAVNCCHYKIIHFLLDKSANINAITFDNGQSALHMAVEKGHLDIVKLLLRYEADVNISTTGTGVTPLHVAAQSGYFKIVELLLSKGVNVDCANIDNATALHLASENGHTETVELLLKNHANVDKKTIKNGSTALLLASKKGHTAVVELLLAYGADPNIKTDYWGFSPLYWAARNNSIEIVSLLEGKGAGIDTVTYFVGHTAMHIAILYGHTEIVEFLLAKGANIELATKVEGWTPLDLAIKYNAFKIITALKEAGAELRREVDTKGSFEIFGSLSGGKSILEGERSGIQEPRKAMKRKYLEPKSFIETFCKRPASPVLGQHYETKLLSMVLFRLLHVDQIKNFYLGNNLDEAGMFDDIVLRTIDAGGKSQVYCLQTRHKPKSSTVKFEDIVNSHDLRGAFNLNKYLESFLQIRYMFSSTNEHAIFHGEYETTELELILFTPAKFIFPEDASYEYMGGCKIFQANKVGKNFRINCSGNITESFVVKSKEWHRNVISTILAKLVLLHKYDSKNLKESIEKLQKENVLSKFTDNAGSFNWLGLLQLYSNPQVKSISNKNVKQMCRDISNLLQEPLIPSHGEHVKLVTDFFGKLRMYSEQATEDELEEIIRRDIKAQHYEKDSTVYNMLHNAVESWWKQTGKVPFLSKSSNIFKKVLFETKLKEIHEKNKKDILSSEIKINSTAFEMNPKWVNLFYGAEFKKELCINIFSSLPQLCCLNLLQYLEYYSFDFLVVTEKSHMQDIYISEFKPQHLIVLFLPSIDVDSIGDFSKKVKQLIFITKQECVGNWRSIKEETSILDLEIQCQDKLLDSEVEFQGYSIQLSVLMENVPLKLIDAVTLEHLINKEKFSISKNIVFNQDDIENYYIERCLRNKRYKTPILKKNHKEYERVIIVAAEAGMGKSTLLPGIAKEIKQMEKKSATWIVRINLCEHSKLFYQWKQANTAIDENLAMNFLIDAARCEQNTSYESFETKLFRWYCEHFKIYLLVDGFDKISPDYADIVLLLLQTYKHNFTTQLWVTTRTGKNQKGLEESLEVCAYFLEPFTEDEIKRYLWKYWSFKLNIKPEINDLFNDYIKEFLLRYSKLNDYRGHKLISVPLQIKMIGMIFENSVKTFCNSNGSQVEFYDPNIVTLYDKFLNNFPEIENISTQLAVWTLYKHAENYPKLIDPVDSLLQEIQPFVDKSGIITQVIDSKPIFVFETAEFLAAKFIWNKYSSPPLEEFESFAKDILTHFIKNDTVQVAFYLQEMALNKTKQSERAAAPIACNILDTLFETLPNSWDSFHKKSISFLLRIVDNSMLFDKDCSKKLHALLQNKPPNSLAILLLKASESGYTRLVKLANELGNDGINITFDWLNRWTALHFAAHRGHKNIVKYLIKKKDSKNAVTMDKGENVLHIAAKAGFRDIVSMLLDHKVDVHGTTADGETALHLASKLGHVEIVRSLIKHEAAIHSRTKYGFTPLHFATKHGHIKVVNYLLGNGANPNEITNDLGFTPLHWAAKNNFPEIAERLIVNGAHISSISILNDQTPLHIARSYGNSEIENLLLGYEANPLSKTN
ncbi:uncharacterized protein LOC6050810 isoform X2 [Culex quinquefasciatus]|nr:uncharacterized protein LOC6050810 isoform X2 [Culex quinquefasciatus]